MPNLMLILSIFLKLQAVKQSGRPELFGLPGTVYYNTLIKLNQSTNHVFSCSPEDIERFREEMVKHQPQLAAAAQKAAAMMSSASEAGTKLLPASANSSKVSPSSAAAVNGESGAADSPQEDCNPQNTASASADVPSGTVEDQSCDQDAAEQSR